MKYKKILKKALIVFTLLIGACSSNKDNKIIVKDTFNNELKLQTEAKRIVSIAPSISEIIYALGAGDKLVGRTIYCKYPKEIEKVESIGDILNPNIEKIISLKPDLVIASSHFKKESQEMLKNLGIKTAVFNGEKSVEDIMGIIEKLALISGKKENGEIILKKMQFDLDEISKKTSKQKSVYYMISYGSFGDYTAGGNTYINEIIELAGGINIAKDMKGWSYSIENLMKKDPDIIICPKGRGIKKGLEKDNLYSKLSAVKNSKVYEIDSDLIDIQGPRIIEGIKLIKDIIDKE